MKIALINASPKFKDSASGMLLDIMKEYIGSRAEVSVFELHKPELAGDIVSGVTAADACVFLFPLYVDGIPSNLLFCLAELGEKARAAQDERGDNIRVYAVVNLGFYEGVQADVALDIMKNWCDKYGLLWGGGAGIGGAGGLAYMPPMPADKGPRAPIDKALKALSEAALSRSATDNIYICIGFPRAFYRMGAQLGWRKIIKSNGLKKSDLGRRPELNK